MAKKCPKCKQESIKILGSNKSCINENCEHYIPNSYDINYITYYGYEDQDDDLEWNVSSIEDNYIEDYDSFLYYSNQKDYISRYEFRKMNNFIEDYIFKNNGIAKFERFLDDEIGINSDVEYKHELIDKGRDLEKSNHKEALDFYKSLIRSNLFENDYYIYKKIVLLEKDLEKQLEFIISFFNSGIYCNRYHYLWFLKKLKMISDKIQVPDEVIEDCLKNFKNKAFNIKNYEYHPVVIAEKITMVKGNLKVRTEEEYALRQFQFELQEEASNLNYYGEFEFIISIYSKLILECGFKATKYFERICTNYHRLGKYDEELKWIYGFFSKVSRFSPSIEEFNNRLKKLKINVNEFDHAGLFFDTNKYYLTKKDFKENNVESDEIWDYFVKIKEKFFMIERGFELESENISQAIEYYESLLNHELFKNDYYIYKTLVLLYNEFDLDKVIDTIFSFFKSGIYCDRYNYLFFIYHLKRASQELIVHDYEIDEHLKYYKEHGFKNKHLESSPVTLYERIIFENGNLDVMPEEDFKTNQELNALNLEADLYHANFMFESENWVYFKMIDEYGLESEDLFKRICNNYQILNDVENESRIINAFFEKFPYLWEYYDKKWFEDRLIELKHTDASRINEPPLEIFYENNPYYLTSEDYSHDEEYTELIDNIRLKFSLKRQGLRLEAEDYQKAIDFYKGLLNNNLFKNDYYVYRRLVLLYVKINEFDFVYDTIKSFFNSGIYCNRYQYIWFLHKLADVSKVKYIGDEEIDDCLKSFKENGFINKHLENTPVFLTDRLYKSRSSIKINSSELYYKTHKKYELKEEVTQYEINGINKKSIEIFRNMIDGTCYSSPRDYMRLFHMYEREGDYENQLYVLNKYLSEGNKKSRDWFEKRLDELTHNC